LNDFVLHCRERKFDIDTVLYKYKYYMSSKLNLSKLVLDQYIGTVFTTLRPNQDKRNNTSKKLKLPSGILPEEYQDYCNPTIIGYQSLI
jgi:hypothetical protein